MKSGKTKKVIKTTVDLKFQKLNRKSYRLMFPICLTNAIYFTFVFLNTHKLK